MAKSKDDNKELYQGIVRILGVAFCLSFCVRNYGVEANASRFPKVLVAQKVSKRYIALTAFSTSGEASAGCFSQRNVKISKNKLKKRQRL